MSLHVFKYPLHAIEVNQQMVAQLMGYPENAIPPEITDIMDSEAQLFPNSEEIQGGYVIKNCTILKDDSEIEIEQFKFSLGKKVLHFFKQSEQIAVFACTAGSYISNRSKELMAEGKILEGYIVDVIGSSIVEKSMSKIHDELRISMKEIGLNVTNRYSPGYCDWQVAEQKKLFALLPKNFSGITLSDSALMTPIKSVSGFIGIGPQVKHHAHTCNLCTSHNCIYRHINTEIKQC